MENNTKKTAAGFAATGLAGVAIGAGITAANMPNNKVELDNIDNPAIVTEDNSNTDVKVTEAIASLTGQTTNSTTFGTTTSTTSTQITTTSIGDASIYEANDLISNSKTNDVSEELTGNIIDVPNTNDVPVDNFTNFDYNCCETMKDAIGWTSLKFDYNGIATLSDMIISTYGVELSEAQTARYNVVMKDTYDAYKNAIDAYEAGDVKTFRKICDDVLNSKKYLNLDDLIDILSININTDSKVIKNSKNYSISRDELVIDGIHVKSLFSNPSYEHRDIMSILSMFDGASSDDLVPLKLLQVPLIVVNEVNSPTSFSLVCGEVMYEYRNEELGEKLYNINNYFVDKTGLNNFGYEQNGNYYSIYGYDKNEQKQYISNDSEYYRDLSPYTINYYPAYQKSKDGRIGYFDGDMFRDYLLRMNEKMQEKSATK